MIQLMSKLFPQVSRPACTVWSIFDFQIFIAWELEHPHLSVNTEGQRKEML